MDLHQEAMAELETVLESPWGLPAMPELKTRAVNRYVECRVQICLCIIYSKLQSPYNTTARTKSKKRPR